MTSKKDTDYYQRRAEAELRMADRAPDAAIADLHLQLAQRYAQFAGSNQRMPLLIVKE